MPIVISYFGSFYIGNNFNSPIGYKEIRSKRGNPVSVFFALEREQSNLRVTSLEQFRYGSKSYEALVSFFGEALKLKSLIHPLVRFFMRDIKNCKIPGFVLGKEPRDKAGDTVVVFSHGIFNGKFGFTQMHKEFAEKGLTVYSIDHFGGSSLYTETPDGKKVNYELGHTYFSWDLRRK